MPRTTTGIPGKQLARFTEDELTDAICTNLDAGAGKLPSLSDLTKAHASAYDNYREPIGGFLSRHYPGLSSYSENDALIMAIKRTRERGMSRVVLIRETADELVRDMIILINMWACFKTDVQLDCGTPPVFTCKRASVPLPKEEDKSFAPLPEKMDPRSPCPFERPLIADEQSLNDRSVCVVGDVFMFSAGSPDEGKQPEQKKQKTEERRDDSDVVVFGPCAYMNSPEHAHPWDMDALDSIPGIPDTPPSDDVLDSVIDEILNNLDPDAIRSLCDGLGASSPERDDASVVLPHEPNETDFVTVLSNGLPR
jgi:hypothetical protein